MGTIRFKEALIVMSLVVWVRSTCASPLVVAVCPTESVSSSILGLPSSYCSIDEGPVSDGFRGVIEGDEISLQRALHMVHKGSHEYVAILFYAHWCPFSEMLRTRFSIMSHFYSSIPHFAVEDSAVRPGTLLKYGVNGFPTFFILNSTMRVRYHGSRTFASLVSFYSDVTGMEISWRNITSDMIGQPSEKQNNIEHESFPFSWAISPENMLRQETYLALATVFVILRLLYLFFPTLLVCLKYSQIMRLRSLFDDPLVYLNGAIPLFNSLKEPCRSNLQDGAMNARVWASKSPATVSIGEASTTLGDQRPNLTDNNMPKKGKKLFLSVKARLPNQQHQNSSF